MASLIANCLARLVKEGRVTPKQAKDAQALHDGMQGRLGEEMGAASAESVAALEAARVMGEQAKARKVSIAKDVIAAKYIDEDMAAHPKGKIAGLGAQLARDPYEVGNPRGNVDKNSQAIFGERLSKLFGPGPEALGSKLGGFRQDTHLAELTLRELKKEDTGNQSAKEIAKAWKSAVDYGANRAKAGGKLFQIADDWSVFQWWTSQRVGGVKADEFLSDIARNMKSGGLQVLDRETGVQATPMKLPELLKGVYHDIVTGGGMGSGSGAFSPQMRVFKFADGKVGADSWLDLMGKYGPGRDLYPAMRNHLQGMAREIALIERFGPSYRSNFEVALQKASAAVKTEGAKVFRGVSSPTMLRKMFDVFTGKSYGIQNEALHAWVAGARGWLTAVQLPGAVISSTLGDSATAALAAQHMDIPAVKVWATALKLIADGPEGRMMTTRLGIDSASVGASAIDHARYAGEWLSHDTPGKAADVILRVTGLSMETDALQRAATVNVLGLINDMAGKSVKDLPPSFGDFLTRYGISPDEWEVLRKTPPVDIEGAKYFDVGGVANQQLGEKIMAAALSERDFFVVTPDLRVRAFMTPQAPKGSLMAIAGQSAGQYRSFAVSMAMTHMLRLAMQPTAATKLAYGLKLALFTTIAGAMTLAAKDLVYGKDPRRMFDTQSPMNTFKFWAQAALVGGGMGPFSEFFNPTLARSNSSSVAAIVGGPMVAAVDDTLQAFSPGFTKLFQGDFRKAPGEFGKGLAQEMRNYLLPTPFYLRLVRDRLLFDQVQSAIDPNYRSSWQRMEQNAQQANGQQFWWRPGQVAPERAPNVSTVLQ